MALSTSNTQELEEKMPSHYFFERILNFREYSQESREKIYRIIHPIYCSCYGWSEFEGYCQYYETLPGTLIVLLLNSRVSENTAGYIVCATDSFFFLPENNTKENLFKVSYHSFCLHPSHRGQKLGIHMFNAIQLVLKELYEGYNRVSFNYFGNIFFYKLFYKSTRFLYPGPFEEKNKNVREFFSVIKNNYLLEEVTKISEFLVEFQMTNFGFDKERYKREHRELDDVSQFFMDSIDLKPGYFLLGLFVHEMIEGNSLELEPRVYEEIPDISYEFRDVQ